MNEQIEARNEYIKFFILLLFFGTLTLGAAMLRPLILGGVQSPQPTGTPTPTALPFYGEIVTPTVIPAVELTSTPSLLPTPTPTGTATAEPQTYVVQAGDSLFQIGRQYGVTVDELVVANEIVNRHRILVGQVLTIPEPGAAPAAGTYTVQWGDTLWGIAQAFGVEVEALAAANDISDPTLLKAGSVIVIPR